MQKLIGKNKRREESCQYDDNVLMPIMSLMVILIPLLIGNLAFFHFKSIEINTPGLQSNQPEATKDANKDVILQLEIHKASVELNLLDEETADILKSEKLHINTEGLQQLQVNLQELKARYKKLATILVITDKDIPYEKLVTILEKCKRARDVAAKEAAFNLVLLSEDAV